MMNIEYTHNKMVVTGQNGSFIVERIHTPINCNGHSDTEYGSKIYTENSIGAHILRVDVPHEPNIKHSWAAIIHIHLELLRKSALVTESSGRELLESLQYYFLDSGLDYRSVTPINGDRIPFRNGEWTHKEDGWEYTLSRITDCHNQYYAKDEIIRTRQQKEGQYDVSEKQSKIMGRNSRDFPPYPIAAEAIKNIFE